MSLDTLANGQPSPEEMQEMQQEMEQQREDRQTAQQLASQFANEQGAAPPGYWSVIGSPGISRDDNDDLEAFTATEFATPFALGNITRQDWQRLGWRIETEFWTMKNEFRDKDSKMGDDDLRMMYGEERPVLDNEKARRLRSASEVKKQYTSGSVEARNLRAGTEIHAVAKTESQDDEEEPGAIGKAKNWLSR